MSIGEIREWQDVDLETFQQQIVPANQPAVIRSLLKDWPAVQRARQSPAVLVDYIKQFDNQRKASAIVGAPSIRGRFFYSEDLSGFNFERKLVTVSTALDNLIALSDKPDPPAIAMQAIPVTEILPDFKQQNVLVVVDKRIAPRMWLGNKTTTAAHYDDYHNIACVVAGHRRFTIFPPEQVANLYVGPLLNTPGGSPISMVNLRQPDLSRYPRFATALEAARQAVLEPGDAIYMPPLWWHAVESLDSINVLVNYWWNDAQSEPGSPFDSLLHSMLAISDLPPSQRKAWQAFFNYFVFQLDRDPKEHLPADLRDVLATLAVDEQKELKAWLSRRLQSID